MKTIMVSLHHKYCVMIIAKIKLWEFRGKNFVNVESGDKIIFYESLGNVCRDCNGLHFYGKEQFAPPNQHRASFEMGENIPDIEMVEVECENCIYNEEKEKGYEGSGKVVGEFIVGSKQETRLFANNEVEYLQRINIGYSYQKYAFEITNLNVYETPKNINEFISKSKFDKYVKGVAIGRDGYNEAEEREYKRELLEDIRKQTLSYGNEILFDKLKLNVDKPPQSFAYVVEL